jgi:hypothetical protein
VIKSFAARPTRRVLVDGGVFVNNPAMCAYAEARSLNVKDEDMLMLSLGTGVATRKMAYDEAKDWGALGWVRPIISVMMDGEADAADHHLRQLLPDAKDGNDQRYFRFDTELDLALDDMDATSTGNILNLKQEAAQIIADQSEEMKRLVKFLKS